MKCCCSERFPWCHAAPCVSAPHAVNAVHTLFRCSSSFLLNAATQLLLVPLLQRKSAFCWFQPHTGVPDELFRPDLSVRVHAIWVAERKQRSAGSRRFRDGFGLISKGGLEGGGNFRPVFFIFFVINLILEVKESGNRENRATKIE